VNVDQVYAMLRHLEREGFVEPDGACGSPHRKASE